MRTGAQLRAGQVQDNSSSRSDGQKTRCRAPCQRDAAGLRGRSHRRPRSPPLRHRLPHRREPPAVRRAPHRSRHCPCRTIPGRSRFFPLGPAAFHAPAEHLHAVGQRLSAAACIVWRSRALPMCVSPVPETRQRAGSCGWSIAGSSCHSDATAVNRRRTPATLL